MDRIGSGVPTHILRDAYELSNKSDSKVQSGGFAERLGEMVAGVDELSDHSVAVQQQFFTGEVTDVHEVMVAGQEAGLAFALMVEVRNKLVEAYQELSRMQV